MKKICSVLLCLCLMLALALPAAAAQEAKMIQVVWTNEEEMMIICAPGAESAGTYQVMIDGKEVPAAESTVRADQVPATVFCLVDTSGSIGEFKLRLIRETLLEISNSLGENDNMVIATTGNTMTVGPLLQTKQEREEAIAAISTTHEDTNLYSGIVQSFEKLTSDTSYNSYGCVVVLSDGLDKQDNGMTEQEVLNAIEKYKRPLYTVALIESGTEREGVKVLGSFARNSYGGVHQTTLGEGANAPVRWDVKGDEFGSVIWTSLQGMAVLRADLSDVEVDIRKTEVRLDVTFTSGSDSYTDYRLINANELPAIPMEIPPLTLAPKGTEEETEPSQTAAETTEPQKDNILSSPLIWVAVACVAILAAVLVLVIMKKKRQDQIQDVGVTQADFQDMGVTQGFTEGAAIGTTIAATGANVVEDLTRKYKIYMTDIPYGTQKLTFTAKEVEVTAFGRDKKRVQCVVNVSDTQLSGKHFAVVLQKDMFCIRDENSTNGTYLNGVSISGKGWVKLLSGDKVRAGSYEYRIIIEPEERN